MILKIVLLYIILSQFTVGQMGTDSETLLKGQLLMVAIIQVISVSPHTDCTWYIKVYFTAAKVYLPTHFSKQAKHEEQECPVSERKIIMNIMCSNTKRNCAVLE